MSKYAKAFVMIALMAMPSMALSQDKDEKPKKQLSAVGIEHGLELYDKDKSDYCVPVSYTHLTLPTIYSV